MHIYTVVRQALMQNQTPEIQAKLLAMQRLMTQPKASGALAELSDTLTISAAAGAELGLEGAKLPISAITKLATSAVLTEANRPRQPKTTVGEKEEQNRYSHCRRKSLLQVNALE